MRKRDLAEFLEAMPKTELHVHLEGAIPHTALFEIIKKYDRSIPDVETLSEKFKYTDFRHFLEMWVWKNSFLREYEDFRFLAEHVARDFAAQNIVYAEMNFSPPMFRQAGLQADKLTEAIRYGFDRVKDVEIKLIADLCRGTGPDNALPMLDQLNEVREKGVIGIDLGGDESERPEKWQIAYRKAEKLGFHRTAHAGEAAGPDSIWGAIQALKTERIGHGTRIKEDPTLLKYLQESQMPVEVCPISNVRTGIISDIAAHPVRLYFDKGLLVSINTDDPKMFQNSLSEEFLSLWQYQHFSIHEIHQLAENSIKSAWCSEEKKQELLGKLDKYFAKAEIEK